ncbi:MAG: hypothetical protein WAO83_10055 [Fuerstiella sp.]
MDVRFVYQAFDLTGKYQWVYDQTLYSILSLMAAHGWNELPGNTAVSVFCDSPSRLEPLTEILDIRQMDSQRILKGMGPQRFIHRLKLDLMIELAKETSVPMIYFDGDVWFKSSLSNHLARLIPNQSLMHVMEYPLGQTRDAMIRQNLTSITSSDTGQLPISSETMMHNAGVIGLHPANFDLLSKAIAFTDQVTPLGYSHTWEQLAVSAALGNATQVSPVDDVVYHYWDQRESYNTAISHRLRQIRQSHMTAADAVAYVRNNPVSIQPYQSSTLLMRAFRKITGRSRVIARQMQDSIERLGESRRAS